MKEYECKQRFNWWNDGYVQFKWPSLWTDQLQSYGKCCVWWQDNTEEWYQSMYYVLFQDKNNVHREIWRLVSAISSQYNAMHRLEDEKVQLDNRPVRTPELQQHRHHQFVPTENRLTKKIGQVMINTSKNKNLISKPYEKLLQWMIKEYNTLL